MLLSIYAAYYPRRAKISPCCSVFSVYIIISIYIYGLNGRQTWTYTLCRILKMFENTMLTNIFVRK